MTQISDLTAITTLDGDEEFVVAQPDSTTRKIVASDLKVAMEPDPFFVEVLKTADESVASSIVYQNDDELFFTAAGATLYDVEVFVLYDSPVGGATPDLKMVFGEDTTGVRGQLNGLGLSATDVQTNYQITTNQTAAVIVGTATSERVIVMRGYHRGNGGTWRVQWAQNTSGVNATRVRAGSFIRYRVLA